MRCTSGLLRLQQRVPLHACALAALYCSLLDLLVQHGYAGEQGKAEWLQNWENIWQVGCWSPNAIGQRMQMYSGRTWGLYLWRFLWQPPCHWCCPAKPTTLALQDNLSRCEPGRSAPCKVVVS